MDKIWIASFDIGKKNFAFCIEEVDVEFLSNVDNVDSKERYFKDGTVTPKFGEVIHKVCQSGKIVLFENLDITQGVDKKAYLDPITFINMTKTLDSYKEYWEKCSVFVIEQQMSFGKQRNTMALKLGQHCFSYFIFHFADFKKVIEFPAFHKTKVLGAPKKMSKYERKMWSVNQAVNILIERDDKDTLKHINSRKKRDDLGDVITQVNAFKYLCFVDKSI